MKRSPIKKIGKKGREWQRARRKLVADLKKTGEYTIIGTNVYGVCLDCGRYKLLTPDHKKRRSQGGKHTKKDIDWVCISCHRERDQMGDPKKKKPKSKKADWQKKHRCRKCKAMISMFLCPFCGAQSI